MGFRMVDLGTLFKVTGVVYLFSLLGRFPHDILRKNKAGLFKFGMLFTSLKDRMGL